MSPFWFDDSPEKRARNKLLAAKNGPRPTCNRLQNIFAVTDVNQQPAANCLASYFGIMEYVFNLTFAKKLATRLS